MTSRPDPVAVEFRFKDFVKSWLYMDNATEISLNHQTGDKLFFDNDEFCIESKEFHYLEKKDSTGENDVTLTVIYILYPV